VLSARKLAVTVPAVLMVLVALTGSGPSPALAVALFSVGAFAHQAISSTLLTLPADLFPRRTVATANGLSGTFGYLGGILFTFLVGRAASTVGYTPLFWGIAVFDLIGAAVLWALLRRNEDAT
jgi:ACS family hexuronate transporter-like MFS transporter